MKYLLASDIHGSFVSVQTIIDKFNKNNCDAIILLGDILYHGPRNDLPENYNPKKAISLLNEYKDKIIAIKGNCDAEVDQMVLEFKIHDSFNLFINNSKILLTHGHHINHNNPINDITYNYVLHGHTHIIDKNIVNNTTYINIGSITLPKNNTPKCYGIIENKISIYDLNDNLILNGGNL